MPRANFTKRATARDTQKNGVQMNDSPPAVLNVCSQFDDFAVCWSLQRELCQSWGVGSLSLVIYEKPQSICVINFVNERQNDVVLGSFNVSQHNVFHGTGSESGTFFLLCRCFFCFFFGWGDCKSATNVAQRGWGWGVSQWMATVRADSANTP